MEPQIAANALRFLERVELRGKEVPAYVEVQRALLELMNPPAKEEPVPEEQKKPEPMADPRILPRWKEADSGG